MRLIAKIFFLVLLILGSTNTLLAKTVVLGVGETYSEGDLNVMCVEQKSEAVVEIKECQFWDKFNDRCLYEKKKFAYGDIECVEECQHWDSFNKRCHYATECAFYPAAGLFVKTVCEEFDDFKNVCKRTKQIKIDSKK